MPKIKNKSRVVKALDSRKKFSKDLGARFYGEPVKFAKALDDEGEQLTHFEIVGNSGTPFKYWDENIVVDFKRSSVDDKTPVLRDHDTNRILGHTTKHKGNLVAEGVMSGEPSEVDPVVAMANRGYPWQSSIYLDTEGYEEYDADHKDPIEVNGRKYKAPLVVLWGRVREYTITTLGADENTSSSFSFTWEPDMDPEDDLQLNDDTDLDALEDDELEDVELDLEDEDMDDEDEYDDPLQSQIAQREYIASIEARAKKIGASNDVVLAALKAKDSPDQLELRVLRSKRIHNPGKRQAVDNSQAGHNVLGAAMLQSLGYKEMPKGGDEKAWETAHKSYRNGSMGLQEMLLDAAEMNGHTIRRFRGNERDVLKAAFSTHTLTTVLSEVQNTIIRNAFMAVEQSWRRVAKIGTVNDFKTHTRYYLTGDMTYLPLTPTGEIQHTTVSQGTYSINAGTYARMMAITRQDLINDNLGAFDEVSRRLGRGAALKLNDVFWTAFMDNSDFFKSDNGNYQEGATTNLGVTGLNAADVLIGAYTDPDGKPFPVTMDRLLVPRALRTVASQVSRDTTLAYGGDDESLVFNSNPWAGRFEVIDSVYLGNSSFTGYSTKAWYLLGNPDDLHAIEVVFLNGRQEPFIESTDVDFDQLGIQTRGYYDFGVALGEYRAGFKSKGEA